MLVYLAIGIGAYLLGTFPSADIAARVATQGKIDIRRHGSGNPGALNATNVLGRKWGVFVLLLDLEKGIVATRLGHLIAGDTGMCIAGVAVALGHIAPVWSAFRGGKGIATVGGALFAAFPIGVLITLVVLAGVVLPTRSTRTAALAAAVALVVAAALWMEMEWPSAWGLPGGWKLLLFASLSAALVSVRFIPIHDGPTGTSNV